MTSPTPPTEARHGVSLVYAKHAPKEGGYPLEGEIQLRLGGEGVLLRVADKRMLWMSEKGARYLGHKGYITWCRHDRCGLDCGTKYAVGVGRNGCAFAHISDEEARNAAQSLLQTHHPDLLTVTTQDEDILTQIDNTPWAKGVPIKETLSVILTTSPTQSNPSTTLLEAVLSSFAEVPQLESCRLTIVCDGIDIAAAEESDKKSKLGFKRGVVTEESSERYAQYKRNVVAIAERRSAEGMPTEVLEMPTRVGFGWAVRSAISEKVRTKYTMVIQHDRYFERHVPLEEILTLMEAGPEGGGGEGGEGVDGPPPSPYPHHYPVVYMQNSSMRHHIKRCRSRLPLLPKGESWEDPYFSKREFLGMQVLPCLAWLDSTHVARTDHLIFFVFGRRGHPAASGVPIRKGDFPEDRLNQAQMKDLKREGIESHRRYGTWYIASDKPHVRHLSGRVFLEDGTSGARARSLLESFAYASDEDEGDDDDEKEDVPEK